MGYIGSVRPCWIWVCFLVILFSCALVEGWSWSLQEPVEMDSELESSARVKKDFHSWAKNHPPENEHELAQSILSRKRRGLGNWIKKVLHLKSKTTPSTTPNPVDTRSTTPEYYEDDDSSESAESSESSEGGSGEDATVKTEGKKKSVSGRTHDGGHEKPLPVTYVSDQHGDTEVDWLLPPSLRRSSIKGVKNGYIQKIPEQTRDVPVSGEASEAEPKYNFMQNVKPEDIEPIVTHHGREKAISSRKFHAKGSGKRHRQSKRRRTTKAPVTQGKSSESVSEEKYRSRSMEETSQEKWKHIFESFDYHKSSVEVQGIPKKNQGVAKSTRQKRSPRRYANRGGRRSLVVTAVMPVTTSTPPPPTGDSIETASKEELRLLHELLISIVNGKCPKPLDNIWAEDIEENIFHIIDTSPTILDTQVETGPEISTLIHQLVNCSIASETQKDILEVFLYEDRQFHSHSHDLEVGAPVSRSKRGRFRQRPTAVDDSVVTAGEKVDNPPSGLKIDAHEPSSSSSPSSSPALLHNFEFTLVSFVTNECANEVSAPLLHSASQLLLETIQKHEQRQSGNEPPEDPKQNENVGTLTKKRTIFPITQSMIESQLNILQFCANLIAKHHEKELRLKRKLQERLNGHHEAVSNY